MTQDVPSSTRCPQCGATVPENAVHGLCPRCVFAKAMAVTGGAAMDPPDLEAVRAAFPQLEVISLIGAGGMGAVFKARQPQLDRFVALKLLVSEHTDEDRFAERFQREAQALARLSHPHIITIHDFGKAGGFYYLLMEYVDGVNLRQATASGRFTPEQALAIVPPICEALQYAHERGIVHRDIKPENLLLDRQGQLKIADFGIARMLGASDTPTDGSSSAGDLTQADALGTPSYMAPEQRTSPATVDHRADIYSLGVVFYELLTGELPNDRFEPPSGKVRIDVRLDEIVLRALSETPERRYNTALEFKTQLAEVTSQASASSKYSPAPLPAAPHGDECSSTIRRSWRPSRRWIAASAALLFIAGALVLTPWLVLPPEYLAKATLEPRASQFTDSPSQREQRPPYDPIAYEIEIQRMLKTAILYPVIQELGLIKVYSGHGPELPKAKVYRLLVRDLQLMEVRARDTGLIEVGAYNTDPQLAANIANVIAVLYQRQEFEDDKDSLERSNYQTKAFISQLRKAVDIDSMEMARIRKSADLLDRDPGDITVPGRKKGEGDSLADVNKYAQAKRQYIHDKNLLETAELRFAEARMKQGLGPSVKIWQMAKPPSSPVGFSPTRLLSRVKSWFERRRDVPSRLVP